MSSVTVRGRVDPRAGLRVTGGTERPVPAATTRRYELRSSEQRDALAAAPLPLGMRADAARRTRHRDIYLDAPDESLRRRGVTCRLRVASDGRQLLSLRMDGQSAAPLRLDAPVRATDPAAALREVTPVARQLAALVDPASLQVRLELEVDRFTRFAHHDLLRRPRLELHYDQVTVRRGAGGREFHQLCAHVLRGDGMELSRLAAALEQAHDLRALVGDPRDHAELLLRWMGASLGDDAPGQFASSDHLATDAPDVARAQPEFLSPELSLVAFQRRVLALAQDHATPLKERLRFLGIVTSNLDELYMVRMAGLRQDAAAADGASVRGPDGLTAITRLERVEHDVAEILEAQSRCAVECLRAAAKVGTQLLQWSELSPAEREALRERCRDEIYPELTPLAMTLSPGHPLPHLPHLGLSLAVLFRRSTESASHLAELELPRDASRLLAVPGRANAVVPIEEVLRANADLLYPNAKVEGAWLFRVTRGGDLDLDEKGADDLLVAVSEATGRRLNNPAVRVEVERAMPASACALVLENLRREAMGKPLGSAVTEVQAITGLLDLRCLAELPLPDDPSLEYPAMPAAAPLDSATVMDAMRERDLLFHHPFDAFDATVVRFLREAAADPDVTTIKVTLYRAGDPSAVVDALLAAARAGKKIAALVELKARFDEEHNVGWARALEAAGASVVYGLVGLKVHAKVALVVRREGARLQRYAHVGTGNYNTRSGRQYTDLSLFSTRDDLTSDVADLFNSLTGSSRPPEKLSHGALVAPHQLLSAVLDRIRRETAHARAGRPARIAIKVNGLSDPEVVRALYDAAAAGVVVDLVVRGICTLRPLATGEPGHLRVISVVGRFLEHSRVYRFENGGTPEFLIGSSDLRPRNLRRRVELLVPVLDDVHTRRLDRILEMYLGDAGGWLLLPDGRYERRPGADSAVPRGVGSGAQAAFAAPPAAPSHPVAANGQRAGSAITR